MTEVELEQETPSIVKSAIAKLLEPLWAEHKILIEKRDEITEKLSAVNEDLRQVEKVLRAADPEAFKIASPNGTLIPEKANHDAVRAVLTAMWREPHVIFTKTILSEKTGFTNSQVQTALENLRADGQVRHMGRVHKAPGQLGAAPVGFKIAEGARPPENGPQPVPQASPRGALGRVSEERLNEIRRWLATVGDRPFTQTDIRAGVPGLSGSSAGYGVRILIEYGEVDQIQTHGPGRAALYRAVKKESDGS